ncbi:MAG: hypothetical protein AUH88_00695 [Acidobacteria bacterium 13_1_40CM_4_61_5]|nr:MAG: hypothetical protein AUH88_00695 [Acidobacteria bacterium 13_1_40CM_4_61_5]
MWSKQQQIDAPASSPAQGPGSSVPSLNAPSAVRPSSPAVQNLARLGSGLQIKGHITGTEDLQIDGKVEGPISLHGHALTVGSTAQLNSEINARDVVVYGKVIGNLHARGRVEVKRDGSVLGDIATARISIEDGAQFRGRIEVDPTKSQTAAD